jgi:release factor glutamine methyltransferase
MIYPVSDDTELLLQAAIEEIREEDIVLEVGTGSGYVADKLRDKCRFMVVSDISPYAVARAKELGLNTVRADLLACFKKKFTLILFNPPYLELEEFERRGDWIEKALDGGKKGVEVMKKFIDQLDTALKEDGRAILIHSSINLPEIHMIIEKKGFVFEELKSKKLFFERLYALKITKRD